MTVEEFYQKMEEDFRHKVKDEPKKMSAKRVKVVERWMKSLMIEAGFWEKNETK